MEKFPEQELVVSYSQIVVYNAGMDNPFTEWMDQHINQGFAWREGTVSFGTLSDSLCSIEVILDGETNTSQKAARSIVVPFTVGSEGITIKSVVSNEYQYDIPSGSYELLFEAIPLEPPNESGLFKVHYQFIFKASDTAKERILKQDGELSPQDPLLMSGRAAI